MKADDNQDADKTQEPSSNKQDSTPEKHQDEIEGLHTKLEDPFEKLMKLRKQLEELDDE